MPRPSSISRSASPHRGSRSFHQSPHSRHPSRSPSREERYSRRSPSRRYSRSPARRTYYDRDYRRSTRYSSSPPYASFSFRRRSPTPYRYSSSPRSSSRHPFRSYRRSSPYLSRSPPVVRFADEGSISPRGRRYRTTSRSPSPTRSRTYANTVAMDEYHTVMECLASVKEMQLQASMAPYQSILMVLRAHVEQRRTSDILPVYILLDSGANTSFILKSTVRRLCLDELHQRLMTVVTFDGHRQTERSGLIEVDLIDENNQPFRVHLNTRERGAAVQTALQLHSEDLAALAASNIDPESLMATRNVEIDIVLGINYFWKIMLDAFTSILPSGLVLTRTRFGYAVSGQSFFR
ncbi:Tas retrotransposon peptidase A16 [Oesophagostomum dentatum]|uniref:Tas retrotransposon peptidase A16 n=1 Tax=Oesophagostomum dentatum TaxID=61180 RepID=A0A0B1S0Q4_OESDE|nr:Tas retrotransposon peptidase A16 [Oesophagostomum dentatum]